MRLIGMKKVLTGETEVGAKLIHDVKTLNKNPLSGCRRGREVVEIII